jgi:hypothetical protein
MHKISFVWVLLVGGKTIVEVVKELRKTLASLLVLNSLLAGILLMLGLIFFRLRYG